LSYLLFFLIFHPCKKPKMKKYFRWVLLLWIPLSTTAQKDSVKDKWDVNNPPGHSTEIKFTTSEGTWMNLDVSPDGKEIVFDLLGDIYLMPVAGGTAKVLRSGLAFEVQPRFSPDGSKISFTSDAGGADNIWVMDHDGKNAEQITKEDFRLLNNAVWSPTGEFLVARKHFTSARSLGAGELWMYHRSGGEGIQLTKRKNDQQDLGEPCYSPDGKYIYYSEDMYPGGYFQYNKDPNSQIYVINRYETKNGEIETITGGSGGAFRPQVSHDGKLLAFVKRVREMSVLFIHNLETGEEWPIYRELSKDQQEAWAIFGVYTNFNWLPGDKEIIIWAGGKLKKINIEKLAVTDIPFTVEATHRITDALHFNQVAAADSFDVKAIRQAVTSGDNKKIIFNAAGYLYVKTLPDGKPRRLTKSKEFEFEPSFSPDGNSLVYVTWNDETLGAVNILKLSDPLSTPFKVTTEKGIYRTPSYSPDGKFIVYQKENGNDSQGYAFTVENGLYVIPVKGGKPYKITKKGANPFFSADGKRVYFQDNNDDLKALKSITTDSKEEQVHFTSKYANSFLLSPDNNWLAFTELFKVYVMPFAPTGKTMDLSSASKAMPVSQAALDAGVALHWSADSKKINWTEGDEYFSREIRKGYAFYADTKDSIALPDSSGIKIGLRLPYDVPSGSIALQGARIITMNSNREVIENGTVLITGNKIVAVGNYGAVTIPAGAKIIDVTGKTIMPGIVDVHAHLGTFRQGLSPQKQWSYFANLAYGVTTTHDPSSNSEMTFSQSEMVKAGIMTGPRIFTTGWILYGADGDFKAVINKPEDASSAIRRTKNFGAFSVKSYNQPRREQNQMIIDAARKLNMEVVPEGGSFFFHNMGMIADGHTGIEHNIPVAPLYNDVLSFWAGSKTAYTPTLIVCYGAMMGENYWYQKTNVWENKKLLKFTPRYVIDSRSRHRTMSPDQEFENGYMLVSRSCKMLADRGVKINLGAHGQLQGLGAHWELWMLQQGGMSPMQVLECATVNGADYIGMQKDIGSLEVGKLADLIVMDKNPLEDIRNSESIIYTMANGRLYDTETMNETGNYNVTRTKFFWENDKYGSEFQWHINSHGDQD
jgi:imidazolonepropionase-like amidohydrolase/Tol biopolymer transport system component